MTFLARLGYFFSSARKQLRRLPLECPNCGKSRAQFVDRKYLVTSLHECLECNLLFRYPPDSPHSLHGFYEHDYDQGETTNLPSEHELANLMDHQFAAHDRSHEDYVQILLALGISAGGKLIDFGCSWGYGTWQLARAGFQVTGLEIANSRAAFGIRNLGLSIVTNEAELPDGVDAFFTSHVLEHLSCPSSVLALARKQLRPDGLFVAFTPNGSAPYRKRVPAAFHKLWGQVHPVLLTDLFFETLIGNNPYLIASRPYDLVQIAGWDGKEPLTLDTSGDELLLVARLSGRSFGNPTPNKAAK